MRKSKRVREKTDHPPDEPVGPNVEHRKRPTCNGTLQNAEEKASANHARNKEGYLTAMTATNQVKSSMPAFGAEPDNVKLFALTRASRSVELIPETLAKVTEHLSKAGYVQGMTFHEATQAETDAYNDKRVTAAKKKDPKAEPPKPISIVGMAEHKAADEAKLIKNYAERAVDTAEEGSPLYNRSVSLRFSNQGTDENPKVLWAFVHVTKRERKAKEAEATEATAS